MPDQNEMLQTIRDAYALRLAKDTAGVARYWSERATFRFAGNPQFLPTALPTERVAARDAVEQLIGLFHFEKLEEVHAVASGNVAIFHWEGSVSTGGGEPFAVELIDLFTFDPDGKVDSLTEFTDTALLAAMLRS